MDPTVYLSAFISISNEKEKINALPIGFDRVEIFGNVNHDCFAFIEKKETGHKQIDSFDITFFDLDFKILLKIKGLKLKKVFHPELAKAKELMGA